MSSVTCLLNIAVRPLSRTLTSKHFLLSSSRSLNSFQIMSESSIFDRVRSSISSLMNGIRYFSSGAGGDAPPPPSWGYEAHNGPDTWAESFPAARGNSQSPIDLRFDLTTYDGKLMETAWNWQYVPEDSKFAKNNGVQLIIDVDADRSSLTGGPLKSEYKIENFHFHWGEDNSCGSEHLLEGKAFPAEVHVVHWNTMYGSFAEAVDKPNGLCVLGCFIQEGPTHEGMAPFFNHLLEHCKHKSGRFDLSLIGGVDPATLLPEAAKSLEFFSYAGSLTTPPCLESVLWINFLDPITFSQEQLETMRTMSQSVDKDEPKFVNNFRPVCPLGKRTVARSFKSLAGKMESASHS